MKGYTLKGNPLLLKQVFRCGVGQSRSGAEWYVYLLWPDVILHLQAVRDDGLP